MIEVLNNELKRRKDTIAQFYYSGIGQILRKRRLELDMTQEAVSVGICSNTYLSKIENNQIVVNREHLYLIMERMFMDMDSITFPEEMIEYLEKSAKLFFYKDIYGYKALFDEVNKYQFSILLQIVKLGYYILIEDLENAELVYSESFRYLQSLEEYGFTMLLLYAGFYNLAINDYKNARIILDKVESLLFNDEILYGLYNYCRFLIYGNLNLQTKAFETGTIAVNIFNKHSNIIRINEVYLWRDVFAIYDGNTASTYLNTNMLRFINTKERNFYLTVMATKSKNPLIYLEHLEPDGDIYLLGLFFKARYYLLNNQMDKYFEAVKIIDDKHYEFKSRIEYSHVLKLMKSKEEWNLKEYLIDAVLPVTLKKQNLYFLKMVTMTISEILEKKKRYKDALSYVQKYEQILLSQQTETYIEIK
ncbi:MAG: helix-turn-helix transcriptional regulator [Candidatus Izemoplasmatales bacterium]|jgi:transcriptional regulator with XRE-family HTH domain|nr:helix-turn-helix transcriptional regulator [Candidatus Izemoplasmatales bacterium]